MLAAPHPDLTYNPAEFWATVGDWYESTCDLDGYRVQEDAIAAVLEPLDWDTVLDIGCGFGRLGMMIKRIRPDATYHGVDINLDLLLSASAHVPNATFWHTAILDFHPKQTYDLVISAECLMHQPEKDMAAIFEDLFWWSNRWVVNCDWYEPGAEGNHWNINHNYPALYGDKIRLTVEAGIPNQTVFLAEAT